MKAWVGTLRKTALNVEFEWPSYLFPEAASVEGPVPPIILDLICKAPNKMEGGKAAGPSGVIAEMLKATGDEGITILRHLAEKVLSNGVAFRDWK
jgi:hypothetical protein